MGLWGCGAVTGAGLRLRWVGPMGDGLTGAIMGLVPSMGLPYVMSVGHEGNHFKIWKFYFICKKRLLNPFPGLRFDVGCTGIV